MSEVCSKIIVCTSLLKFFSGLTHQSFLKSSGVRNEGLTLETFLIRHFIYRI